MDNILAFHHSISATHFFKAISGALIFYEYMYVYLAIRKYVHVKRNVRNIIHQLLIKFVTLNKISIARPTQVP